MARTEPKPEIGIGLIGAGFMGRCHANAFASVDCLFDLSVRPVKAVLCDVTEDAARAGATALGFARSTVDWQGLVEDEAVDIVAIAAPNALHEPIALAAIRAGKTVYCEKPLSTTASSALAMAEAAEAAGIITSVGFNFLRNPMIKLAKEIIASGEIGDVLSFRGRHAENYMASPDAPHSFRTDPLGGGALADIGSHIISLAMHLLGPIVRVSADCRTLYSYRPIALASAQRAPVEVDDVTHVLIEFANSVGGSLEANWAATGRTMDLSFEITGSKGAVTFTQELMNELKLYTGSGARAGYRRIEAGPFHPPYARFCPAPGHHLGFNDLKIIEVAELLEAHVKGGRCTPNFRDACDVQRVVETMRRSSDLKAWLPTRLDHAFHRLPH